MAASLLTCKHWRVGRGGSAVIPHQAGTQITANLSDHRSFQVWSTSYSRLFKAFEEVAFSQTCNSLLSHSLEQIQQLNLEAGLTHTYYRMGNIALLLERGVALKETTTHHLTRRVRLPSQNRQR